MSNTRHFSWSDTHTDLNIADWEMARRSGRRCTACRRPCKGHPGATGSKCAIAAAAERLGVDPEDIEEYPPLPSSNDAQGATGEDMSYQTPPGSPHPLSYSRVTVSSAPPAFDAWPHHDWDPPSSDRAANSYVPSVGDTTPVSTSPPISVSGSRSEVHTVQAIGRPLT